MNEHIMQNLKKSNIDNFLLLHVSNYVWSKDLRNFELSSMNVWTNESIDDWTNKWMKETEIHDHFLDWVLISEIFTDL